LLTDSAVQLLQETCQARIGLPQLRVLRPHDVQSHGPDAGIAIAEEREKKGISRLDQLQNRPAELLAKVAPRRSPNDAWEIVNLLECGDDSFDRGLRNPSGTR